MAEWFEAKVSFLRMMENGLVKKISEQYLVDSHSFTECEARVLQEQGDGVREIAVATMKRSPIKEVVYYGDTDLWFKVKVTYSAIDEATEKEKKITTYLLVNASNVIEATQRTEEHLKEMLVPYQIPKVEESKIVDVFEHVSGTKRVAPTVEKVPINPHQPVNETQVVFDGMASKLGLHITAITSGGKETTFKGDGFVSHLDTTNPADGNPHGFEMEEECAMDHRQHIEGKPPRLRAGISEPLEIFDIN